MHFVVYYFSNFLIIFLNLGRLWCATRNFSFIGIMMFIFKRAVGYIHLSWGGICSYFINKGCIKVPKPLMINFLFPGKVEVFQSRFILSFLAESIMLYSVLNTIIESQKKKKKKNWTLRLITKYTTKKRGYPNVLKTTGIAPKRSVIGSKFLSRRFLSRRFKPYIC